MSWPTLTVPDLANFSGRPEESYNPAYAPEAISQATFLLGLATHLKNNYVSVDAWTDQLVKYAILSMANELALSQEHQDAAVSPFASETIGSYSYSKASNQVKLGQATGIAWFDQAVAELSIGAESIGSSATSVFENDFPVHYDSAGNRVVSLPRLGEVYGHDPAGRYPV